VAKGVPPGVLKRLTTDDYFEVIEFTIAERFGWELEYVRNLGMLDRMKCLAWMGGTNQAIAEANS
jgi:hypothetical protein